MLPVSSSLSFRKLSRQAAYRLLLVMFCKQFHQPDRLRSQLLRNGRLSLSGFLPGDRLEPTLEYMEERKSDQVECMHSVRLLFGKIDGKVRW